MKNIFKSGSLIFFSILITFISTYYFCTVSNEKTTRNTFSNLQLSNIKSELGLLHDATELSNQTKEKIIKSIFEKAYLLMLANPNISTLKNQSLETLQLLYERKSIFDIIKQPAMVNHLKSYLTKIQDPINKKVLSHNNIMKQPYTEDLLKSHVRSSAENKP